MTLKQLIASVGVEDMNKKISVVDDMLIVGAEQTSTMPVQRIDTVQEKDDFTKFLEKTI